MGRDERQQSNSSGTLVAVIGVGLVLAILAILAIVAVAGLFWLRTNVVGMQTVTSEPRTVTEAQSIPPAAVRDARVILGEGFLSKTVFFDNQSIGGVSDIQSGDFDPQPGNEIAIVGWYGGVLLDEQSRVTSHVHFEKGFSPVNVIDVEGDETCEYLNRGGAGWQDAALIDHDGSVVWTHGGTPAVDDMNAGDLDGDGVLEFVVGFNGDGGVCLLDRSGQLRWRQPDRNVWHVEIVDADGDDQLDIVHSNAGGEIVVRDRQGAVVSRGKAQPYIADFSVCRWPTSQDGSFIVLAEDGVILMVDFLANTVASLDAPHCREHGLAKATPVKLLNGGQEHFAVVIQFDNWNRSILYVYDPNQKLVFQEVLSQQCAAIAAFPINDENRDYLLIGGHGKVWRYELQPSRSVQRIGCCGWSTYALLRGCGL